MIAAFFVFNSNTVALIGMVVASVTSILVALIQTNKLHQEIKSPNGTTTGQAIYDIDNRLEEYRGDLSGVLVLLTKHIQEHDDKPA